MPYEPHIRMTMLGVIGTAGEIFSMGIALDRHPRTNAPGAGALWDDLLGAKPNEGVFTAWRDNVTAWFARPETRIRNHAVLKRVKFASIGADGLYTDAPKEYEVNVAGGQVGQPVFPNQVALAVTLGTDGDLGRVKGRVYQPAPGFTLLDSTGAIQNGQEAEPAGSMDQLLTDLGNQPGIDILDLVPVVASQGRRNSNGTIRVPAMNHPIVRVACGRVLDTQRRRRNKLQEARVFQGVDN